MNKLLTDDALLSDPSGEPVAKSDVAESVAGSFTRRQPRNPWVTRAFWTLGVLLLAMAAVGTHRAAVGEVVVTPSSSQPSASPPLRWLRTRFLASLGAALSTGGTAVKLLPRALSRLHLAGGLWRLSWLVPTAPPVAPACPLAVQAARAVHPSLHMSLVATLAAIARASRALLLSTAHQPLPAVAKAAAARAARAPLMVMVRPFLRGVIGAVAGCLAVFLGGV